MAILSQLIATAYPEVLNEKRKAVNLWAESSFLAAMEDGGGVLRRPGGSAIEVELDYRKNSATDFLATDFTATSTSQTLVLGGASYDMANLVVPVNYSIADEARWSGDANKKLDAIKSLLGNAIDSHDDELELGAFGTSTDGFLGFQNVIPTSGQPNIGGIDGASAAYWRNYAATYAADGSDLSTALATAWVNITKGSLAKRKPNMLVSGPDAYVLYMDSLVDQKRFAGESMTADGGFKYLAYNTAKFVMSQHGDTLASNPIYMFNTMDINLVVTKGYFRRLEDAERFTNAAARNQVVFSQIQLISRDPSRTAVIREA